MLKKTITFTDYNEVEQTEDFYFNLSKAELTVMELSAKGGLEKMINEIIEAEDNELIVAIFQDLIAKSVGVKSRDGRRFIKNDEVRDDFIQTEAYSVLFIELASDAGAAAAFVNGITPKVQLSMTIPKE